MAQPTVVVSPRPRRWPRRLLIGLNIFVAVCLVLTASAYLYVHHLLDNIVHKPCASCRAEEPPGGAMTVLLIGSDSRKDLTPAERAQFGSAQDVGGERSDVMMLLRVDPKAAKAAILSIPRDLWVTLPKNRQSKINSAFEGGPDELIATIHSALGIPIDHYAEVDFNGFRQIINVVGGVDFYFPAPARDKETGLDIRTAGCITLDGAGSLKLVRSRHYTYREGNRWIEDPTGDLGRIQRQQDFIRRVLRKVSKVRNPLTLNQLISKGASNLTVDKRLSTDDMLKIGRRFHSLSPEAVDMETLPTTAAGRGGQSVLLLKRPDADSVIASFLGAERPAQTGGPLPPVVPNTIRVRVLNGTGSAGQASDVASSLAQANFNVAGTGDADSFRYIQSVVRYGPGQLAKAQLLQPYIGGGAQLRADNTIKGLDLVLVTGADFSGILLPSGVTTTTTAKPAPTTTAAPKPGAPGAKPAAPAAPAC